MRESFAPRRILHAVLATVLALQAAAACRTAPAGPYRVILNGLATVAPVTRSSALSDELRILVRRYRRDAQYVVSVEDAARICLIAAASHSDLKKRRDFVGGWLTELAFSELEGNEGEILYSYLQHLCHLVPELWVSCGRADAALMAYKASRHSTSA